MKIAVYTICKNESQFVERWITSMYNNGKGADSAYVLDTGSTDDTIKQFKKTIKKLNIPKNWLHIKKKKYKFFRFDIARNDNLDMMPKDTYNALVQVDLDEVLIPQFWEDLRLTILKHPNFERINYLYAWNHNDNGDNGRVFWYNKVHPQGGFRYKAAVHECSENVEPDKYHYEGEYDLNPEIVYLHHYPDKTKSRAQYLPLLEIRVKEAPEDLNGLIYLVREYVAYNPKDLKGLTAAL